MPDHFFDFAVDDVLAALAVPRTETNQKQMETLLRAFKIFLERNELRKDLWRRAGWRDSLHHIESKTLRIADLDEGESVAEYIDDALDLINYTAFFIRNVEDPA